MSIENAIARIQQREANSLECMLFSKGVQYTRHEANAASYRETLHILREEGCIPEPKPRYFVPQACQVTDRKNDKLVAQFYDHATAQDYADYRNKKEDKGA